MWPVRPSWDGRWDFIEGRSCLLTLHIDQYQYQYQCHMSLDVAR